MTEQDLLTDEELRLKAGAADFTLSEFRHTKCFKCSLNISKAQDFKTLEVLIASKLQS